MIGVFSGTSDGVNFVEMLLQKNYEVVCFNATKYGGSLYESKEHLLVYDYTMDKEEIKNKIKEHDLTAIVDCTHPFAKIISKNLIELTDEMDIPYYRFERPEIYMGNYDSYEEIIEELNQKEGNILLTIGSNNLDIFANNIDHKRLYCRMLPTVKVVEKATNLGLTPKNIIAIQGPFSYEMNIAMLKDFNIKHLVTKASGKTGGVEEKIKAAIDMGLETYILKRPGLDYKKSFPSLEKMIEEF